MIAPEGEAFAARVDVVTAMVRGGTPFFPALAAGLEDQDWILVYAAVRDMANSIRRDTDNVAGNRAEEPALRNMRKDAAAHTRTPQESTEHDSKGE